MKPLLALALLPLAAQSAPRPAWDVADKWTCAMTRLRVCEKMGGACSIRDNPAAFRIDFPNQRFGVDVPASIYPQRAAATPAQDFYEAIVARSWLAPGDDDPGFSKFVLDSGDTVSLSGVPRKGETRDAILTRSQIDSQYLFYGTCSPVR
jgi:hypothetical protein